MAVIGITIMAIILFVTAAVPLPATALLIAFFQVLLRVGRPNQIAQTFAGDAIFFIMGVLLISNVLIEQKIDKRLAHFLLKATKLNAKFILFSIMFVATMSSALIGEHTAAALLYPIAISLIAGLSEENQQKERFAKLILFTLAYSAMVGGMGTPSGGARNPLMIEFLWRMHGINISYFQWTLMVMPVALFIAFVIFFLLKRIYKTDLKSISFSKDTFDQSANSSGSKHNEKLTVTIFAIILIMWILFSNKIGMGIIALLGVLAYIIIGVIDWSDLSKRTNWGIILVYGSAISLGLAMKQTGVTGWMANLISDTLYSLNITGKPFILGFNALVSSLFSDFLSHAPSVAVTGPIFLKLAVLSKINILYMGLINAMAASFGFLTIIASPVNALIYTSGHIKPVDYLKTGVITTIVAVTIIVIISILYWSLLGYHL